MKNLENVKVLDTRFNKTYIITSVTEKRINMDEPGNKSTTSTGRSSSKFWVGVERFNEYIKEGKYLIQ